MKKFAVRAWLIFIKNHNFKLFTKQPSHTSKCHHFHHQTHFLTFIYSADLKKETKPTSSKMKKFAGPAWLIFIKNHNFKLFTKQPSHTSNCHHFHHQTHFFTFIYSADLNNDTKPTSSKMKKIAGPAWLIFIKNHNFKLFTKQREVFLCCILDFKCG